MKLWQSRMEEGETGGDFHVASKQNLAVAAICLGGQKAVNSVYHARSCHPSPAYHVRARRRLHIAVNGSPAKIWPRILYMVRNSTLTNVVLAISHAEIVFRWSMTIAIPVANFYSIQLIILA